MSLITHLSNISIIKYSNNFNNIYLFSKTTFKI